MSDLQTMYASFIAPMLARAASMFPSSHSHHGLLGKRPQTLAAVVTLLLVSLVTYDRILSPPKRLRHLGSLSFFTTFRYLLKKQHRDDLIKYHVEPVVNQTEHGMYVRFDAIGWAVHMTRPEQISKVLLKSELFPKGDLSEKRRGTLIGRLFLRPNIIFLDGPEWKKRRKIANRVFQRSMPVQLFGELAQKALHYLEVQDSPVDVMLFTQRFSLDVIGRIGLDFDFQALEDINSHWVASYNNVMQRIVRGTLFLLFPAIDRNFHTLFPKHRKAHDDLTRILELMDTIIISKRAQVEAAKATVSADTDANKDLLTLMLEDAAVSEDGLTNEEIQSDLCAFFVAGHDTTAVTLSFVIYHLSAYPLVQQRAREEVIKVMGDQPLDVLPTANDITEMIYVDMVIKETLRLFPVLTTLTARIATEDCEVGGVMIPKGTKLVVDIYEMHRNPRVWKDPSVFRPERFAPGDEADQHAKPGQAWIPFGTGSHQCVGMKTALLSMRVLVAMLLRKFTWHLPDNSIHQEQVVTEGNATVRPKDLKVVFEKLY